MCARRSAFSDTSSARMSDAPASASATDGTPLSAATYFAASVSILAFRSSVSFPCPVIESRMARFRSSSSVRYAQRSASSRSWISFISPVRSLRYRAMNGTVAPSAKRSSALRTWNGWSESSVDRIRGMSIMDPRLRNLTVYPPAGTSLSRRRTFDPTFAGLELTHPPAGCRWKRRGSIAERDNPALAIHKHGDFRVRQNLVRFAADHESRYPAPAVGGHENYVAASFRRSLDNLLPRMVTDLVDHLVGDPGQLGSLL